MSNKRRNSPRNTKERKKGNYGAHRVSQSFFVNWNKATDKTRIKKRNRTTEYTEYTELLSSFSVCFVCSVIDFFNRRLISGSIHSFVLLTSKIVKFLTKFSDQRERFLASTQKRRIGWRPCRPVFLCGNFLFALDSFVSYSKPQIMTVRSIPNLAMCQSAH